jgi:hypothetical protein
VRSSHCPAKGRCVLRGRSLQLGATGRAATIAAIVAASLLAPSAADAAPAAEPARATQAGGLLDAGSHLTLAQLETRAGLLARQYRGQLASLTDAAAAATAATRRALLLRRQLGSAQLQIGRLAAESYMGGGLDPALALLSGGDPQRALDRASMIEYLAHQGSAAERRLQLLVVAENRAGQAAQAKVAGLRRLLATLTSQRRTVDRLLARFRPQSPVIGADHLTPRMIQVRDEIDRRFGPFVAIGCYRPGTDGEHPLGRACDFMLSSGGVMPSASNVQLGYDITVWAQANASRLGIMYIIYRQRIWDIRIASSGWVPMADRGSITANHFDHVHISVF